MSAIIKAPSVAPPDFTTLYARIWDQIQISHKILLHFHPNPDPDSVGAALAMGLLLERLGKQVTVSSGDSPPDPWLKNLPGCHLVRFLPVSGLDLSGFDLFIILDSASPAQVSAFPGFYLPPSLATVIIDHHPTNRRFAKLNLVNPAAAAACEILYDLFLGWGQTITPDIAADLYIGLHADTLGFGGINASPKSLHIAAALASINPDFSKYIFSIANSSSPGQISALTAFLQSIKVYFSGHVAMASGPSADSWVTGSALSLMHSVIGWDICILLRSESPALTRVSFRTRDSAAYDVSKLAVALGGGGHAFAAGATLAMSLPAAKKAVLAAITTCFPQLTAR